ncbi:hypothetical protein ZIOFF_006155 [Zingiber officinale]|uniref:Ubiquitin thioesterase OTU1 n=1 Tax=Zingiber officinale TaxID=94328 RepID=A0A8J5LN52_ZINOF|nr:hypothetical protein ZIOFF_006155 [Zingiber officinale]
MLFDFSDTLKSARKKEVKHQGILCFPPFFVTGKQEKNYSERVMLIYDGLHYDALAVCQFCGRLRKRLSLSTFQHNS